MLRVSQIIAAGGLALTLATSAVAGHQWTGAYVGAMAGYASANTEMTDIDGYYTTGERFDVDSDNAMIGAVFGINGQSGHWVYGIEAEAGVIAADGSAVQPSSGGDLVANVDGGLYLSAAGRLGYAWDHWLVYAKAGVAAFDADVSLVELGTEIARADGLTAGAIYGAGLEYAFNDKWSVRAEYLRFDIGSDELVAPGFNLYEAETDVDTFRLGITVKLGS